MSTHPGHTETPAAPDGVRVDPVTKWLENHVDAVTRPVGVSLITGGHSNLTFTLADASGRRWVLRRPPLGQVLATAHDVAREYRVISALADTSVPLPPLVGLCTDDSVNDAPFYVMDFVDGVVVRDAAAADNMTVDQRHRAGQSLIEVLASIHAVDPNAVGLGDLARHDGYIERQLKRWHGQFESSRSRELPIMDDVHRTLCASVPDQGPASIVHGDFRLDNCMLGPDGTVVAVLDWELCTLGDPLADLGLLLVYWSQQGEQGPLEINPATAADGFPTRNELVARYGEITGRDTSSIDFYVAFGYWKLACILEGVASRYAGGAMGSDRSDDYAGFASMVEILASAAQETAGKL